MSEIHYDNSSYWKDIHKEYSGTLRAVGWPTLCEEINRLKYESEADTFVSTLEGMRLKSVANILEVGVGVGFWTSLQKDFFSSKGCEPKITVLDISKDALDLVQSKFPGLSTLEADLKTVPLDCCVGQFDLVTAIMVILHLTDVESYLRALKFCARSVVADGHFLVYEPFLFRNYSPYSSQAFNSFDQNSTPRPLIMIDNVLHNEGFDRVALNPGASWLLNSPIQADTSIGFGFRKFIWNNLIRFAYRSDTVTSFFAPLLVAVDRRLKSGSNALSGSFALYRRRPLGTV